MFPANSTIQLFNICCLWINDSVEWFLEEIDTDGVRHQFGIAVATGAPIDDPIRAALKRQSREDVTIIFWLTTSQAPDGREARYMTTLSLQDFKKTPLELKEAQMPRWEHLAELLEKAIRPVDQAQRTYLESIRRPGPLM